MIKNNKILVDFVKLLLVFWIPIIALVSLKLYSVSIIYFGILALIVKMKRPYMLISLFVYFLPLSSIIGTENNLFGLIGFKAITQLFIISFFFTLKQKAPPLTAIQKYVIYILLTIAAYYLYYTTKGIVYGYDLGEDVKSINYVFKLLIKSILKYLPLILIVKMMGLYKIRAYVLPAVIASLVTIALSMLMVEPMLDFGFVLAENEYALNEVEGGTIRAIGLYKAGGDTNSVSGFFLIAFGFYLAQYENVKKLKPFLFLFGLTILGLFLTASRTGMIALALMIFLFFIRNLKNKGMPKLFFFGLVFFVFSSTLVLKSIERFYADSAKRALNKDNDARLGYYFIYGKYFIEHPEVMLTGYTDTPIWYKRPPHNFFMLMLYNGGFLFPCLFLLNLFRIVQERKKSSKHLYLVYMVIPMFLILATINSEGAAIYFWIFISAIPFFYKGRDQALVFNKT